MSGGRALPPTSPFAGDDGSPDPALAAALAAHAAAEHGDLAAVVAALAGARVLVPVLAQVEVAGAVGHDVGGAAVELAVDKEASAGVVALRVPDGRTALPVFSGTAAMTAWRASARPVPTHGPKAALSAVHEGWEVLVVDPAGPVAAVVPRPAVWALAQGRSWAPAVVAGVVAPEVDTAVRTALAGLPAVVAVATAPGARAEVAVHLALAPGLDRAGLDATLARVNAALAADELVAGRVDSLELRVRAAA